MAGFSHRAIGRRSRDLMERISLSIADDVMREERAIAEAQHTGELFLFLCLMNTSKGFQPLK